MKVFFLLLIGAAAVYGIYRYAPEGAVTRALESAGLAKFFKETAPAYLRTKFSIPQNPAAERKKYIEEISPAISGVGAELEAIVPPRLNGGKSAPKVAGSQEIHERVEKSRELLAQSQEALEKLKSANSAENPFNKTAGRIIDKIIPAPAETGTIPACEPASR